MNIRTAIERLVGREDLSAEEMQSVMQEVMTGQATDAQIGGFLVALRMKGESVSEITGAAKTMRSLAKPVVVDIPTAVDTCGTGGDGANLFNVSTAAAFVVAAAGGHVAKHGNRSVSSSTGSADLLEKAGVNLALDADQVARAVREVGVGFMFAPAHHSAMKHAIGPRKELGLRTIFNMLGPLTNPAGVKRQVLGVFDQSLCRPVAEVLKTLGSEHVLVVHSKDGLDEFSVADITSVAELKDGKVTEFEFVPRQKFESLAGLSVESSEASLALIQSAFEPGSVSGDVEKARAMIGLNAGAAIYVSGLASSIIVGASMADDILSTGLAGEKLRELVEFSLC